MLPIETELNPDDRNALLDRIARQVTRRRLEVPAVLALEIHRPLSYVGSQALVLFTPLLAPVLGLENLQKLSKLLEEPGNVERLLDRIEELAMERRIAERSVKAESHE